MGETTKLIRSAGGKATAIGGVDGAKLTALSDGYLDFDLSRFPDVTRGLGDELATADGQDLNDLTISVNAFLLETDGKLCLIDAGDGQRRAPTLGHLLTALKAAGYEPADVTHLLMTHLHGDHAAGLVHEGRPLFPNADMYVSKEEARFWNSPAEHDEIQATQTPLALAALEAYRERTVLFDPGGDVLPGVATMALPGHTPGQIGYGVGTTDPVLICADVLHFPALQVTCPDWGFLFDQSKIGAEMMRRNLLALAADTGLRLAGAHMPFPGAIRVSRTETGYAYETAAG